MHQKADSGVKYAPMYVYHFQLAMASNPTNSADYEACGSVPDRLRWLRLSRGLTQAEAAKHLEISLSAYKSMEEGGTQHIPKEMSDRIAQFYSISVMDLLDEYSRFLYDGQAARIRSYRESLGLGKKPFARAMGIPIRSLQSWENETKAISRTCWERYFKRRS